MAGPSLWYRLRKPAYGVLVGLVGGGSMVVWRYGDLPLSRRLVELELATYDDRADWRADVRLRGESDPLVIVAIDEVSINSFSDNQGLTYPWPRDVHAQLVDKLSAAGAKVIVFDVNFDTVTPAPNQKPPAPDDYFWEPEPCAADRQFAEAIRRAGNVILALVVEQKVEMNQGREELVENAAYPAALFDDAAAAHADAKTPTDVDGKVRRARTESQFREERLASLPVAAAAAYLTEGQPGTLEQRALKYAEDWRSRHATAIGRDGSFPVDFRGPAGTIKTLHYADVLAYGDEQLSYLKNQIVLVGSTAPELHDEFDVPVRRGGALGTTQEPMPGVEIHANAIRTLLADRCVRPAPDWTAIVSTLLLGCLTGLMVFHLRPARALALYVPLVTLGWIAGSFWVFIYRDLWISLVLPILGGVGVACLGSTVLAYLTVERERKRIQSAWGKRVSPEVLQRILQNPGLQHVVGRTLQATVLFSDLRSFTTLCHTWRPEEVVRRLNEIFERMTRVITEHGGTIDKFIGDGIMAVFGDPVPHEDHARRALLASIDMMRAMQELQAQARARGDQPIEMGVGIHTGELVAGDIGSELFLEYTAIGDTVSTASRLEGLNKEYHTNIICSGDTLAHAGQGLPVRLIGTTTVRGRETPLEVYEVLWAKPKGGNAGDGEEEGGDGKREGQ